jgi:hypothetical protein
MDFERGNEAEQEQQYIEFEQQDEENTMAATANHSKACEVMVQTVGGEFNSFNKPIRGQMQLLDVQDCEAARRRVVDRPLSPSES